LIVSVAKVLGIEPGKVFTWPVNEFYGVMYSLETLAIIEEAKLNDIIAKRKK